MAHTTTSWGAAALIAAIAAPTLHADFFYSLDITNDELVLIDSVTADVISIGSVGEDLPDTDLTVANDRLYGTARFPNNELIEFNLNTALVSFRADLPFLSTVKGLAADASGQLICSYAEGAHTDPVLATLALDGTITPFTSELGYDIDGLGMAPDDATYAVNLALTPTVAEIGPPAVVLDSLTAGANDVASTDTDLWALASDGTLMRISRATGLLEETIALDSDGRDLYGIVLAPCIGDVNFDGATDVFDFAIFSAVFGAMLGEPNYVPECDINNDGSIDVFDFGLFAADFACPF